MLFLRKFSVKSAEPDSIVALAQQHLCYMYVFNPKNSTAPEQWYLFYNERHSVCIQYF